MFDQKDIIGTANDFLASNIDIGDEGEMRSIAQALLIAVEALESIEGPCYMLPPMKNESPDAKIAHKALSRIRSL